MPDGQPLAAWDRAVTAYLSSRHALGRQYTKEAYYLGRLRAFLLAQQAPDLDATRFAQWRAQGRHLKVSTRVVRDQTVFRFCRYRRRREPACYLPDPTALTRPGPRPLPIIIAPAQVNQLLATIAALPALSYAPWRPLVLRIAVLLLYTTGLRRGELVRLTLADTDIEQGTLFIRESKHHRSRWVPLAPGVCQEVADYLACRRAFGVDCSPASPLIINVRGVAYSLNGCQRAIRTCLLAAGIRDRRGRCPRLQDFRHSFAVAALQRWYEAGADVQVCLPKLALYMGHVSILSTAYYLRRMPGVIAQASQRFEQSYAPLIHGEPL